MRAINKALGSHSTDSELLSAVRSGDTDAFGVLYLRYQSMASAIAFKHSQDKNRAEDLVSEAFARILQALKNGKGPQEYMGGYISTTIAHLAAEFGMLATREVPSETEHLEAMGSLDESVLKLHEADEVVSAFTLLPERWQIALWMSEVEGRRPREVAAALKMTPNAASALTLRARESLREGFLRAHQNAPQTAECGRFSAHISPYVRGSLSQKRSDALRVHMEKCSFCTSEYLSLVSINKSMRTWIFPVLAGLGVLVTDSSKVFALLAAGTGSALATSGMAPLAGVASSGAGSYSANALGLGASGKGALAGASSLDKASSFGWLSSSPAVTTAVVASVAVATAGAVIYSSQNHAQSEELSANMLGPAPASSMAIPATAAPTLSPSEPQAQPEKTIPAPLAIYPSTSAQILDEPVAENPVAIPAAAPLLESPVTPASSPAQVIPAAAPGLKVTVLATPSATPSVAPSATHSATPSATPTLTQSPSPFVTPSASPSSSVSASPTPVSGSFSEWADEDSTPTKNPSGSSSAEKPVGQAKPSASSATSASPRSNESGSSSNTAGSIAPTAQQTKAESPVSAPTSALPATAVPVTPVAVPSSSELTGPSASSSKSGS